MRDITLKLDVARKDKYQITSQGFLVVDANLTRAGVFDYYEDGKLIRELRSPEEVFKQESLDSLKFAPLTIQHPKDMVDSNNAKRLQVGMVGENITKRGDYVGGKVVITDQNSIDDILAKWDKGQDVELSMGYKADVVTLAGTHHTDGPYDKAQRDIIYNHASVVDKGRAGSNVKLIRDAMDAEGEASPFLDAEEVDGEHLTKKMKDQERPLQTIIISKEVASSLEAAKTLAKNFLKKGEALSKSEETSTSYRFRQVDPGRFVEGSFKTFKPKGKKGVALVFGTLKSKKDTEGNKMFKFKKDSVEAGKFKMDSILEEVDKSAKDVIGILDTKIDEAAIVILDMAKDQDELQAKFDESTEANKKLQEKNDELSSPTSETVQTMIKERTDLEGVAVKLDIKTDSEDGKAKDSKTLKLDVIAKVHPEFKADGQSDIYIGARFDAVKAMLKADKDGKAAATLATFIKDAEEEKGKTKKDPREKFLDSTKDYHKTDDK